MRKMLLLVASFLLLSWQLSAQTRTISGKVTDEKSAPVPNVSITVKGSTVGTTSNEEGVFSITVPDNAKTLVFSAVGMAAYEVAIGSKTVIAVTLKPEEKSLQEVVVVGYGKTTKQAYTGSAVTVTGEKLNSKAVSSVSQALAGEVAGVRVINTSGQPGTNATIRIRGYGSVNGNRDPLYVIDGVPFTGNINSINMADIESTTVLKDATATAIYGSRGANGVIILTTKSGKGKGYIDVDGRVGFNKALIPRYDVIKSPEDYIGLAWEGLYNEGLSLGRTPEQAATRANTRIFNNSTGIHPSYNLWNVTSVADLIDPVTHKVKPGVTRKYDPENWQDYAFQSSGRQEVNVKLGGGDGRTNYFTSVGYLNDIGYSLNSDFRRLTGRLNVNHEVKKWLVGSMNISYANTKLNNSGQEANSASVFWFVDNIPSIYPLYLRNAKGERLLDTILNNGYIFDYGENRDFANKTNGVADAVLNTRRSDRNELSGNTSLTVKFTKDLSLETRFGVQYYNNSAMVRTSKFYGPFSLKKGGLSQTKTEMLNYNALALLRYTKRFGDHSIEALAAHENSAYKQVITALSKYNMVMYEGENFNNAVVSDPIGSSYTNEQKLESYFAQVNYDYDGKYYLSGTIRRDGSSRFVKNKWSNFGSIGAGWIISNEAFLANNKWISFLKLKASYGLTGEQNGVGFYPGYDMYNVDNLNDMPALSFASKGNPDLTWETSKMVQAGVEFRIKDWITGSVDVYRKNTTDLLFDRRVGPSSGYAIVKVNDGILRNQGVEVDLTGHILKGKDYYVNLNVNAEFLTNKIIQMPIDTFGSRKVIDVQGNFAWGKNHSIYDFYLPEFAGVDPNDGKSTWYAYYNDENGNNQADKGEYIQSLTPFQANNPGKMGNVKKTTTKVYAGKEAGDEGATTYYVGKSAIPKVRGAVSLTAGYKGFDFAVQVLYGIGGYSYDGAYASLMQNGTPGSNNWHKDMLNRWTTPQQVTDVPRLSNGSDANTSSASTRFLTKANFIGLNNVRVGYTLPKTITGRLLISEASFYVSGDNLYFSSKRRGFNPTVTESGSSSVYTYAPLSTITVGLRVKF